MAPAADREGYWGLTTSTLDWCEENYAVTWYMAEFCECGRRPPARGAVLRGRRRVRKAAGGPGAAAGLPREAGGGAPAGGQEWGVLLMRGPVGGPGVSGEECRRPGGPWV